MPPLLALLWVLIAQVLNTAQHKTSQAPSHFETLRFQIEIAKYPFTASAY